MNRANENNMNVNRTKKNSTPNIRWMLVGYDLIVYVVAAVILLVLYGGMDKLSTTGILQQVCLSVLCVFAARLIGKVYGQVMLYPAAVYRFYCFYCVSVSGTSASSAKNDICQNVVISQYELVRCVSVTYALSLCV